MDISNFIKVKDIFKNADTETKIDIYCNTQGLSMAQYKELLAIFPLKELPKLEDALSRL